MKTRLFFIGILLMSVSMFGQLEEIKVNGNYYFKYNTEKKNTELNEILIRNTNKDNNTNQDTSDTNKSKDTYIVKTGSIKVISVKDNKVTYYYLSDKSDTKKAYEISKDEFEKMMSIYYNRLEWKVGFFAVPFKLRFNDFEFESDISLGTNLSFKYRFNRTREDGFALEPLFGLGITKVNLDEYNSKIESPGSTSAFTINSGLLIHVNGKINFGLFYGGDFLAKKDNSQYDWKHNGNGWLGVGLNITFSETNKNDQK
ncbi:MAG: hypothetical protein JNJ52_00380 [Flavobacterium sp.]|nr:hypothetical protein [Flavobacterium sp.]